ncbi:GerAB/ArcD/ProY family transporter [Priestia megaterium]|uniref:GerAB/ArcD/ProY family transporter n=1 Tax=Priestia megaterium TaxID=1404 RepID=UPI002A69B09D|nr:GerAB/ArcD/ProY family transporter [Priestia megaterium]MDY0943710.1 GerAB/ArcD/ProY family transporter [Priestia megaterium]
MVGGFLLFLVYYQLHRYYPDLLLVELTQKIMGKWIGRLVSFLYIFYFANLASRVIRDFGDMLLTFAYPDTPLFIVNALLMFVVIYTVSKGIEVLARSSQLLFILLYLFAISGFLLIVCSGLLDFKNLKPVLENGLWLPLKVSLTQNVYFPFGETIVFLMILPYVKNVSKGIGISAIGLTGINLMTTMIINVSVLGLSLTARSQFPLLSTVESIQVADFLERLDVFFMLTAVIGGFIRTSVFFYAVVIGYMPSYLDENIGISDTISTPITAIVLIIMVPFAITFGKLGDKLGNKKVISIGLVLGIVLSIISFQFLNMGSMPFLFIGLLMLGIVLSVYEGTMPGSLPTLFHTDIRYRTLSWTFNISVSIFGGTTPLVASWLVHVTGNNLAPGFYLLAVSLIGLIVVLTLFKDTAGKSLEGSYPTVASKAEYKEAVENPKDSLWWHTEQTEK